MMTQAETKDFKALQARVSDLEARLRDALGSRALPHVHVNNGKDDACLKCGLDLRNEIHIREAKTQ